MPVLEEAYDLRARLAWSATSPSPSPQGKDEAERTVKGYQPLKQAINKAYLNTEKQVSNKQVSDWPDPDRFTLPRFPTGA